MHSRCEILQLNINHTLHGGPKNPGLVPQVPLWSVSSSLCVLTMEITATVWFFCSVQLWRKANIKCDTDIHLGTSGVRDSYKGPNTKSVEASGKISSLNLNDLLIRLSPIQKLHAISVWNGLVKYWHSIRRKVLSRKGACLITANLQEVRTTDLLSHFNWKLDCCKLKGLRAVSVCGHVLAL